MKVISNPLPVMDSYRSGRAQAKVVPDLCLLDRAKAKRAGQGRAGIGAFPLEAGIGLS